MSLPIIISFSILGGIIVLVVLGLAFRANPKRTAFFLTLLAAFVLLFVGANFFPFILLTLISGLLFLFSFATLATSWTWMVEKLNIIESRFLQIWNPRKAYGGAIFGDLANAIGVFAGMGATRLLSDAAWWWIGQVAVVLALAVGLSLLWRSFHERVENSLGLLGFLEDDSLFWDGAARRTARESAFKKANGAKYAAAFNYLVGTATWFSLMLITSNNVNEVRREDIRWLWVAIAALILLYLIFLTGYFLRKDELRGKPETRAGDIFVLICIWLATIAIITITIILRVDVELIVASGVTEISGIVIGIFGILLWIVSEGQSWLTLSLQWNKEGFDSVVALDYLVWEKNLWEIAGGLTTIVFLSAVLSDAINGRSSTAGLQSVDTYRILFIVGATLGLFGTLRGILSGILNRFKE